MEPAKRVNIYIDWANLHRSAQAYGFDINYKQFYIWLKLKYEARRVFLFIGFVEKFTERYLWLQEYGYQIVFKDVTQTAGTTKGNCDGELILKASSDFYEREFDSCIIVSADGDFFCLVDFLANRKSIDAIVAPSSKRCSIFLKRSTIPLTYLDDLYPKFSVFCGQNEKAPDADASA